MLFCSFNVNFDICTKFSLVCSVGKQISSTSPPQLSIQGTRPTPWREFRTSRCQGPGWEYAHNMASRSESIGGLKARCWLTGGFLHGPGCPSSRGEPCAWLPRPGARENQDISRCHGIRPTKYLFYPMGVGTEDSTAGSHPWWKRRETLALVM